jgi:hypothetical protein
LKVTPLSARRIRREFEIATRWVASEIGEDGLRSGERPLGVDEPIRATQRRERGVEGALLGKGREVAEEGEAAGCMQSCEAVETP